MLLRFEAMTTHSHGKSIIKSVSIERGLCKEAEARSKGLDLTFSKYIQVLIKKDLDVREDLALKESPTPYGVSNHGRRP